MRELLTLMTLIAASWAAAADEVKDQFLWLEDVTSEKALAWVKERNAASTAELTKGPEFAALNERLLKILDSKDRIPMISKHGDWFYNFWRDAMTRTSAVFGGGSRWMNIARTSPTGKSCWISMP
jgi:prolyl oligopeptidase